MVDDGPETDHLPFLEPVERTTGFDERLPKSRLFVTRPNVASHYGTFGR